MLDHPHVMIQDRFTRPAGFSGEDTTEICRDCKQAASISGRYMFANNPAAATENDLPRAFVRVRLPTMDAYLCAEHFDERKAKDDVTRKISDALSHGFSTGNYENAYTSTDLDSAWEDDSEDYPEAIDPLTKASFRAAFVIGFFGTYEPDEILDSEQKDEHYGVMGGAHVSPRTRSRSRHVRDLRRLRLVRPC
jgi:hypothetical protein